MIVNHKGTSSTTEAQKTQRRTELLFGFQKTKSVRLSVFVSL